MKIRLPRSDAVWQWLVAGCILLAALSLIAGAVTAGLYVAGAIDPFPGP